MFSTAGKFFRGNLHTHSTRSDGALEPEEVCKRYKAEGYDFISLTDHFVGLYDYPVVDTSPFRDSQFTTVLGAELHSGTMENGEIWHILAAGLPSDFTPSNSPDFQALENQETGPELAKRARDAGAFVAIAHPHWSAMAMNDARSIEAAHAVEVYNHGCGIECDRGEGLHLADMLLNEGKKLNFCATDDAHFKSPDHFGGWVMVKAEENDPEALLAALKVGSHYSSTGPDFTHIHWEENQVVIESSAICVASLQGKGTRTHQVFGDSMTRAIIPYGQLTPSPWLRVTIIDRAGKRAWSNPHWPD